MRVAARASKRGGSPTGKWTLLAVLFLVVLYSMPLMRGRGEEQHRQTLLDRAAELHTALMRYHVKHGEFPASLEPATMAPLSEEGFFPRTDELGVPLQGGGPRFYVALERGQQFWTLLQLESDPSFLVVVANTSQLLPDMPGWWNGVFLLNSNGLAPIKRR